MEFTSEPIRHGQGGTVFRVWRYPEPESYLVVTPDVRGRRRFAKRGEAFDYLDEVEHAEPESAQADAGRRLKLPFVGAEIRIPRLGR